MNIDENIVGIYYAYLTIDDAEQVGELIAMFHDYEMAMDYCSYLDTVGCRYVAIGEDGERINFD